jgi:hypothetical protein
MYIVTDLLKTLLGNGLVNMFQHATMGAVFSVDECYSSLLGITTILAIEGVLYVVRDAQQWKCFLCGPRHVTVEVFSMWSALRLYKESLFLALMSTLYIVKDRPVLSSERTPHINEPGTVRQHEKKFWS